MKIAICDDQPDVLEQINLQIQSIDENCEIDMFSEIELFFNAVDGEKEYDAVFMDIEWFDSSSGIDYAAVLKNSSTSVVFVTGYPQKYVEKIFNGKIDPVGFLRKPIDEEQLAFLISKIKHKYLDDQNCLTYSRNGKKFLLDVNDINYFEGNLHKMFICLIDGRRIEVSQSLSKAKENLPKKFIECHKSYIINPDHVDTFATSKVKMKNGIEVPVSRAKSSSARAIFIEYTAANI
jgi:DNA-binding LytR/AlgR family response regulator